MSKKSCLLQERASSPSRSLISTIWAQELVNWNWNNLLSAIICYDTVIAILRRA